MSGLGNVFNQITVAIDEILDWIPFGSTVNNGLDFCAKLILDCTVGKIETKNRLYEHLKEKSYTDCLLLMIPGVNVLFKVVRLKWHYASNVASDSTTDTVIPFINYNPGRNVAHIVDKRSLKPLASGGLFFVTAKDLKESFKSIKDQFKFSKDDLLKEDIELCYKMMENYFNACSRTLPTLLRNIAALKLPTWVINIGTIIVGQRPDSELFVEAVTALKQEQYEFGSVNIKAKESSGYHTMARVVLCREQAVEGKGGKYDLIIGNVGLGCDFHITDENNHLIPFVLKGMTLEQITDKEFVQKLIDISTCVEEDNEYAQNFYHSLINYADKMNKDDNKIRDNIEIIGWEMICAEDKDLLDSKRKAAGEYKGCASPLQKMGNCIYKSPEALIKTMVKLLKGRDSGRMIFLLLMNQWENDFKDIPQDVKEKKIYDESVQMIIKKIKDLANLEKKTIEEIIENYCTEIQQSILKMRNIYNPDETTENEVVTSHEDLVEDSKIELLSGMVESSHVEKIVENFKIVQKDDSENTTISNE